MKRCIEVFCCAGTIAFAAPALAADMCSITLVPTLGFPNYDVFAAAPTTTSQIAKFNCNVKAMTMTIGIGQSATSNSIVNRQMAAGSNRLNYNIYKDGGYSALWGDGTAGTSPLVVNTTKKNTSVSIYGKIDPGQDVPVGNYNDTVVLSVNP